MYVPTLASISLMVVCLTFGIAFCEVPITGVLLATCCI